MAEKKIGGDWAAESRLPLDVFQNLELPVSPCYHLVAAWILAAQIWW